MCLCVGSNFYPVYFIDTPKALLQRGGSQTWPSQKHHLVFAGLIYVCNTTCESHCKVSVGKLLSLWRYSCTDIGDNLDKMITYFNLFIKSGCSSHFILSYLHRIFAAIAGQLLCKLSHRWAARVQNVRQKRREDTQFSDRAEPSADEETSSLLCISLDG